MGDFRPALLSRVASVLGALAAQLLWNSIAQADGYGWLFPYFSGNNSANQLTQTAPAGAGSKTVPNIGTFADGVGPVTAHDGTVYIGNQQGQVMAFTADGERLWTTYVSGGEPIVTSGMVWNDRFYVIGSTGTSAALYIFNPDGRQAGREAITQPPNTRIKVGAPQITFASRDAVVPGQPNVVVPVAYEAPPVYKTYLLTFFESGALSVFQEIDILTPTTTGGFGSASISGKDPVLPYPTTASWTDSRTGTSYIVVADGYQSLVVYKTSAYGVTEVKRWRNTDRMRSFIITPVVQIDGQGRGVILAFHWGGYLAATFDGSNEYRLKTYLSYTMPVLTSAAAFSMLDDELWINDPNGTRKVRVPGTSIVPGAASQTYVYISTTDAFLTFRRVPEYEQVSRVDWVGGGRNPPIIGPKGHIYAIASNILFIFPPPKAPGPMDGVSVLTPGAQLGTAPDKKQKTPVLGTAEQVDGQSFSPNSPSQPTQPPQPASTLPPTQLYDPPLTANGNRLFACEELDQDDCGKGDHRAISLAWCQAQGYAKVSGFDVDSRKVRAETLNGQFCSKNKCKVFDSIGCEN